MARLKAFTKYLISFLLVFFVVGFLSDRIMLTRFKPVKDGQVEESRIELNDIECRATHQNGYIEGIVKNKTGVDVSKVTMKLELYNDRDRLVKTDYIIIEDLKIDEEKPFKSPFYREADINSYKIIEIEYE